MLAAAHDSGDEDCTPYFNGAPPPTAVPVSPPMEKTVRFSFLKVPTSRSTRVAMVTCTRPSDMSGKVVVDFRNFSWLIEVAAILSCNEGLSMVGRSKWG